LVLSGRWIRALGTFPFKLASLLDGRSGNRFPSHLQDAVNMFGELEEKN
jgi:hypothetical protein